MEYKYSTINEVNHFEFGEAVVGDIQLTERMFHLVLDNVKICPENSCNRDIRMMRTNELLFKIYLICVILRFQMQKSFRLLRKDTTNTMLMEI